MNEELKIFVKIKKKWGGGGGRLGVVRLGCERRIEVFVKIKKKMFFFFFFFFFWGGGGQGRCNKDVKSL